ncbi:uncharacterized protein LOC116794957 isoform X2 [Chiroxiphia lanceolata]|uniref:uncharacterized protein LOC116794957 isoform X2 n=1 Tax=Chiroxiphia lanceolata TaxID=296741 RepID=UPI0013CE9D17|nr:uncharacterized protein LOC116794957 isoform X2 [Chiroxiphia lanceolata]
MFLRWTSSTSSALPCVLRDSWAILLENLKQIPPGKETAPTCFAKVADCCEEDVFEDPSSDIWVKVLISLDCKYSFERQAVPCSRTWRTNMPNTVHSGPGPGGAGGEGQHRTLASVEETIPAVGQSQPCSSSSNGSNPFPSPCYSCPSFLFCWLKTGSPMRAEEQLEQGLDVGLSHSLLGAGALTAGSQPKSVTHVFKQTLC